VRDYGLDADERAAFKAIADQIEEQVIASKGE
jgi:hypothetical protein